MSIASHRTTFALDVQTVRRLKLLAARWQVSQAEVVRRAIANAEALAGSDPNDAVEQLVALHKAGGGLTPRAARAQIAEVREARKMWRGA